MLVLHLGMPKTGTSLVQNCMSIYDREDGSLVDYTSIGRDQLVAHHPIAQALRTEGVASPLVRALIDRLRKPGERPIIVSSEALSNLVGLPSLLDVLSDFIGQCRDLDKIHCILAIREMTSFRESMYLQTTRVGNSTAKIEGYVAASIKAVPRFFEGVAQLRECLKRDLHLPMVTKAFDSVAELEAAANVPADTFGQYRSRIPSTAKRSFKAQTALLHWQDIEHRVGQQLERRRFLRALSRGAEFEDDTFNYSIISAKLADDLTHTALKAAARNGLQNYVDAFGGEREERPPHYIMDLARLSSRDIDFIASHAHVKRSAGKHPLARE